MNLFKSIYSWFKSLYGYNLYDYFAGKDCYGDTVFGNQFDGVIGWIVLAMAVVSAIVFYFVCKSNMGRKWKWIASILIVSFISWIFGFGYAKYKEYDMPAYIIYGIDNCYIPEGEDIAMAASGYKFDGDEEMDEDILEEESIEEEETYTSGGCEAYVPCDDAIPQITNANYFAFGIVNAILALCYFFILSIILKRFSKHAAHNPWESKFGPQSVKRK